MQKKRIKFPTRQEVACSRQRWSFGLGLSALILWGIAFSIRPFLGYRLVVYGFICPIMSLIGLRKGILCFRVKPEPMTYAGITLSIVGFLIALLPWIFPIAR